jgi:hypothetical protein
MRPRKSLSRERPATLHPPQEIERLSRRGKAEAACVAGIAEFGYLNLYFLCFSIMALIEIQYE